MILKIHIQKEREVIMYYHFSYTSTLPYLRGEILNSSVTIRADGIDEKNLILFLSENCKLSDIPIFCETKINANETHAIREIRKIAKKANNISIFLIDDFDEYLTLLKDIKSQYTYRYLKGNFIILNEIKIFGNPVDDYIFLATIQKNE